MTSLAKRNLVITVLSLSALWLWFASPLNQASASVSPAAPVSASLSPTLPLTNTLTNTVYLPLVYRPYMVDLALSLSDHQPYAEVGDALTYNLVVSNVGANPVTGAVISDVFPATLTGVAWTCGASGGASCGTSGGSGNISVTADFPLTGTVTFTISATFNADAIHTAAVFVPAGASETDSSNNTATDSTLIAPAPPPLAAGWLAYLNYYRILANLPALTENPGWSAAAAQHACYMVKNDYIGHDEPDAQGGCFSQDGVVVAAKSNVMGTSDISTTDFYAIDLWMKGPFHAIGMLDPQLQAVGFGSYHEAGTGSGITDWKMAAVLDVIDGLVDPVPSGISFPIMWPGDGAIVYLRSYDGSESPDPLVDCPGYLASTGLPILLQVGDGSVMPPLTVSNTVITQRDGSSVEHCEFDELTFTYPDPTQEAIARSVLGARDAVVLIPRFPLTPGERYTVTVTMNDNTVYQWSFGVSRSASLPVTQPRLKVEIR
jgi:uncharacterized repeat protein (TIGR01451 family)